MSIPAMNAAEAAPSSVNRTRVILSDSDEEAAEVSAASTGGTTSAGDASFELADGESEDEDDDAEGGSSSAE